ncbi:MAG: B12-binding domain-containing radical SAM protein [Gemmatimonadaceae bacterium]
MRVALVTQHANARFMPLALLYLKASLVARGDVQAADVTIAEFDDNATAAQIAKAVVDARPDVVGLSCYVWNIAVLEQAARRIRAALPQVRLVMGGPEVGPVADAVLARNPVIDAIVRSEGEVPLCDLIRCWRDGAALAEVAGITWRDGGRLVQNPDAPIVRDLNQVVSPHLAGYIDHTGRVICLETQRGCVFTCSFCFYNKDYSIRNRRFDLDRVKEELRFWLAQDVNEIYLMDPVFNLNAARAKEICRFIAENNPRRIPFHTEVWAEFIDDEMAALFARANFAFIEVGLQTSDHAVLDIVERRFKREDFIRGIGRLGAHRLGFELQLIAGLPGETLDTFRASLDFAASFAPPHLSVFDLMILPGTELSRKAGSLGIAFDPEPPYHVRSHLSMPAADIEHARDMADVATRLWSFQTVRLLTRAVGGGYAELVEDWLAWNGGPSRHGEARALLPAFVARWCARRPVDDRFFTTSAAIESQAGGS